MDRQISLIALGIIAIVAIVWLILMFKSSITGRAAVTSEMFRVTSYQPSLRAYGAFGAFSGNNAISCFDECESYTYGTMQHRQCYTKCLQVLRKLRRTG